MRSLIAAAGFILLVPAAAPQDVALKDLMPKGMVVGVAINQRQFDGTDTAAVDIITKQFNQISPENVLKFQPTQPAADRYTFDAADRYVQFGLDRHMQVVGHNLVWHSQTGRLGLRGRRRQAGRSRHAARAHARSHPHGRRSLQRQDSRLGRRQRSDRGGRLDAQVAVAGRHRRRLRGQGVRVRARGRPRRRAVLQRLQSREAREACRRDQARARISRRASCVSTASATRRTGGSTRRRSTRSTRRSWSCTPPD